jgi:FixJ family two-component response regulator
MNTVHLVSIVDDDVSVRESIPDLLKQFGFSSRTFASAEEFLASPDINQAGCLILDVAMPGMSGPDLQRELLRRGCRIPIIFVTGNNDEGVRTRLLAQGAAAVLFKPFSDIALWQALNDVFGTL